MNAARTGIAGAPVSATFAERVVAWHVRHGRHDLPWQNTRDPYRIWISEVMLQQTQVAAVIPYYDRFLAAFPDVASLARATRDAVFALWSGLGYYRRAKHLHEAAQRIAARHGGVFPRDAEAIAALPGIGRSTAAAIAAFAFGTRGAILDGNVKRVLARHRGVEGYPGLPAVERTLWAIAEAALPEGDIEPYTQAMMDLGATVCARQRPRCDMCPVAGDCVARATHRTALLPAARPVRVLPRRAVHVLLVEMAGRILLERRPERGVWAGLWSLPEAPLDVAAGVLAARYGSTVESVTALSPLEHTFTHYRLTLHPLRIALTTAPCDEPAPDSAWLTHAEALALGVPAPIRALLSRGAARDSTPNCELFAA